MDVVVIVFVLGALAVMIFKKFTSFVYYVCAVDIFFRIINYVSSNIHIEFINNFINKYIPNGVESIIRSYSSGIFTTVLVWLLVLIYGYLGVRLVKLLLKK